MISCIIVNNNTANEVKVKNISEENIFKKCNFKTSNDFYKLYSYDYDIYKIELWGKNKGSKNNKSKFKLFKDLNLEVFGKSLFVMKNNDTYVSLFNNTFCEIFNIKNEDNKNTENIIPQESTKKPLKEDKENLEDLEDLEDIKDLQDIKDLEDQEDQEDLVNNEFDDQEELNKLDDDKCSNYSYNSELSYEVYNYSSDEN